MDENANQTDAILWLQKMIEDRGWNVAELARKSGMKDAQIWRVINGDQGGGVKFWNRMAEVLDTSPVTVFRMAGLLPPGMPDDISWEDFKVVLAQLPKPDRDELLRIAQIRLERLRKEANAGGDPQEVPVPNI